MNLRACSFCGKWEGERRLDTGERLFLIVGPAVTICDDCVELCNEVIAGEAHEEGKRPVVHSPYG